MQALRVCVRAGASNSFRLPRNLQPIRYAVSRMQLNLYSTQSNSLREPLDSFVRRHIGSSDEQISEMLQTLNLSSLEELTDKAIPKAIHRTTTFELPEEGHKGEQIILDELQQIMSKNKSYRSYIGTGFYGTKVPGVILRNVLENPLWYTPYTPYQAEISQGRLESLLNFQTMICDLTGMKFANASLLDEATACAEAMSFVMKNTKLKSDRFLISDKVHPQNIAVAKARAGPQGIEVIVGDPFTHNYEANPVAGVLVQYPDTEGNITRFSELTASLRARGVFSVFAADPLALCLLKAPGELGADVAVGSTQRFGVPMGYGGPHAGYFAVNDIAWARKIPGRVVGVSQDTKGQRALRLTLQTREQHIRREKATSNICTAQALPANLSVFYAIYHGPEGLKDIAKKVHLLSVYLADQAQAFGYKLKHQNFFDTIALSHPQATSDQIIERALAANINLRKLDNQTVGISLDETVEVEDVQELLRVLSLNGKPPGDLPESVSSAVLNNADFKRTSEFLTNQVFHRYHKEHTLLRYIYRLSAKDISLCTSMIPLGSCTMKLNATSEMIPITWNTANLHPFIPENQALGYQKVVKDLEKFLCAVTGLAAVSLQPNAGSAGEYTGLLVIREYLRATGQTNRNVVFIPSSAHGTNPASAAMAGLKIVVIPCDASGYISINTLKEKAAEYQDSLAALMVTYPSTYGIFEESIKDVCKIIHDHGGQVYLDGANLNAMVGLTSLREIGADVCHFNLHKTFCIPHGGGGPGMGPIAVAPHLKDYLPGHPFASHSSTAIGPVAAAPYGSASILLITWMYIKMMGAQGLRKASQVAILNANYMKERLKDYYPVKYTSNSGMVAHEFIVDLRPFKQTAKVEVADVAKRLMDYNFHAPTMSWPVPGTLMIEPTESESKDEVDRFCNAMIAIREEISSIESGNQPTENNVLKNAPHVATELTASDWDRPYSRDHAAYPLPYLREHKFWPAVNRVDNEFGDTHLVCSCPPLDSYL